MKSKIISSILCISALIATVLLVYYAPSEIPDDTDEPAETVGETENEADAVVSRAYVIEAAHDAEDLFLKLAYGKEKTYESELQSLSLRFTKSAEYLKDNLQDYYGATYFTKLSEIFKEILDSPFENTADFSARASRILTEIENSYPADEATKLDENHPTEPMYYPSFDTDASGSTAMGLLAIYRQQYVKSSGSILLTFGGNVVMGDTILGSASVNSFENSVKNTDQQYPLYKVSSLLGTDSSSFANLQAPLTESVGGSESAETIKGLPQYAQLMKDSGLDILSLSDPMVNGYGQDGKTDTLRAFNDAGLNFTDEGSVSYFKTDIGTVAYLSYDIIDEVRGNVNLNYVEAPKQDIAAARAQGAVIVVVHFNWVTTMKNSHEPCTSQVLTARSAIDNGANLVFGSHQGFASGIEQYNGVSIVYSGGNLFSKTGEDAPSFLYQQAFSLDAEGKAVPGEILIVPVGNANGDNALPALLMDQQNADQLKKNLVTLSKGLRYGINKRNTFTTDHIGVISITK